MSIYRSTNHALITDQCGHICTRKVYSPYISASKNNLSIIWSQNYIAVIIFMHSIILHVNNLLPTSGVYNPCTHVYLQEACCVELLKSLFHSWLPSANLSQLPSTLPVLAKVSVCMSPFIVCIIIMHGH